MVHQGQYRNVVCRLSLKPLLDEGASEDVEKKRDEWSRSVGGWKGLKPLVSHCPMDTGWRGEGEAIVILHISSPSPPPPLPPESFPVPFLFSEWITSIFIHCLPSCAVGVTVGYAASCTPSPCTPGSDRKNEHILSPALCLCMRTTRLVCWATGVPQCWPQLHCLASNAAIHLRFQFSYFRRPFCTLIFIQKEIRPLAENISTYFFSF